MTSHTHSQVTSSAPDRSGAARVDRRTIRNLLLAAPVVAAAVLLLGLELAGGAPETVPEGLPDPGGLTSWGLPLARLLFDVSAVAVVGTLVATLLLPDSRLADAGARGLRVARWAAAAWAVTALVLLLLSVSDILAEPLSAGLTSRFLGYVWQFSLGRSLLLVLAVALVLTAYAGWTRTRAGVAVLFALAVGALLPVLFSGHSASSADHDLATSSLVVHVVASSVWVGGLGAMLVLFRRDTALMARVVPRYSVLALVCFTAVAFSGLLNAWVRTSGDLGLWATSGYGALLAVKFAALVALGFIGWNHRQHTIDRLRTGRPRAFARLAVGEVLVMGATLGVAVALSRTPPPLGATEDIPTHGPGHNTLASDVEPFTLVKLVTEWRPDAVTLVLLGAGIGFYLAGVRRLRGQGQPWPWPRVAAAVAAAAVGLVATSGGLGAYSTATFSLQVAQFMVLFMVIPTLVTFGRPVELIVRIARPGLPRDEPASLPSSMRSRGFTWLTDPLNTLIVVTTLLFGLYATPLLEASLTSAPLHLLVNLSVLGLGFLFWWSVLGLDPVPAPRPRSYRLWVLAGFGLLFAGIAVRIYLSEVLLAGDWFADLDWTWVEMPLDQRLGAQLMWIGALVLAPLLALLARPRPGLATERDTEDADTEDAGAEDAGAESPS
jgi:cytochrome c oxidase assembly factor CtaG/putative copper export protein